MLEYVRKLDEDENPYPDQLPEPLRWRHRELECYMEAISQRQPPKIRYYTIGDAREAGILPKQPPNHVLDESRPDGEGQKWRSELIARPEMIRKPRIEGNDRPSTWSSMKQISPPKITWQDLQNAWKMASAQFWARPVPTRIVGAI